MGLLFILTASECTNQKRSPGPPQCLVFPSEHVQQLFTAGPRRNAVFKASCRLRVSFSSWCCHSSSVGCSSFLWAKAVTWRAGQEEMGRQGSGCSLLQPPAAALSLLPVELQHCCHCWTHGEALWDLPKNPSTTCLLAIVLMFCQNVGLERMWNSVRLKISSLVQSVWTLVGIEFLRSVLKAMLCSKSLGKVPHACTLTCRSHFPGFLKSKKMTRLLAASRESTWAAMYCKDVIRMWTEVAAKHSSPAPAGAGLVTLGGIGFRGARGQKSVLPAFWFLLQVVPFWDASHYGVSSSLKLIFLTEVQWCWRS